MCNVFGYVNICNKTSKKTRLRAVALFFMFKNCYNNARKAYDFMKQQKYNAKDLTLAYFLNAEFGFLGVVVPTLVHTPLF